jgi:hypothetical protein
MHSSKLRSRDRQRLRAEVDAVVSELPIPYALEALAKRLDVRTGLFEVWMSDGFLREVTRLNRSYDLRLPDGRVFPLVGAETFTPERLWEPSLRPSRRIGRPAARSISDERRS